MEILLIGNGFDLEHSLPTSYRNFLKFCEKARRIYTFDVKTNRAEALNEYTRNNLENWEMDASIKDALTHAFESRSFNPIVQDGSSQEVNVATTSQALNELYTLIDHNTWLEYFLNCSSYTGENWIDLEAEISRVIQALNEARDKMIAGNSLTDIIKSNRIVLIIVKYSKGTMQSYLKDVSAIDKFIGFLNKELERLIRALEIYIAEFVNQIPIAKKSADIEGLNPDHVLSFNYSDTYARVYDTEKKIEYDYIHGKADLGKSVTACNLVLGIDEYLDEDRKDKELEFLTFKKFYQRIYKSTGNAYLNWVDEIKDGYADYLNIERNRIYIGKECPTHTLYIFGHSLDITDRDILKLFICNDNVQTKIFFHRRSEDDKTSLGKMIRNLIKIMGQDELIRRTGGAHKTIEFIPQTLSE